MFRSTSRHERGAWSRGRMREGRCRGCSSPELLAAGRGRSERPRRRSARRGRRRGRRSAAGSMSPVARLRQSATPCQSGVAQASGSSQSGSCEIGKKVPEKRKSGTSPKRKIAASHSSPSTLDVTAASTAAEREPAEERRERREHRERARRTPRRSPRRPRRSSRRRSPARRTTRGSRPRARGPGRASRRPRGTCAAT